VNKRGESTIRNKMYTKHSDTLSTHQPLITCKRTGQRGADPSLSLPGESGSSLSSLRLKITLLSTSFWHGHFIHFAVANRETTNLDLDHSSGPQRQPPGATYLQWVSRICTSVFGGFCSRKYRRLIYKRGGLPHHFEIKQDFSCFRTHGRRGRGHTPNVRRSLQRCAASGDSIMKCALGSNLSRDERKSRGRI
jgi:hypothetical protein